MNRKIRARRDPKVLVIILAGGAGTRLRPLTNDRAKPAVPFAGSYRVIDFALSNFANARFLKIVVLTQYMSHSLDRHISQAWRFSTMLGNYVAPVPAQMRLGERWFSGSADAILQNLNTISDEDPDHVCVFGADHIYRMDPRQMLDEHVASGAGVTIAAIPVPKKEAPEFGVIEADEDGRILHFHEKSANPPTMPGDATRCLASMGNYIFDRDVLEEAVTPLGDDGKLSDIGAHVLPRLTERGIARVYDFSRNEIPGQDARERGYWRDIGSLDVFYDTNMDLVAPVPRFSLYNSEWPIYSHNPPLPPAKVSRGPADEPPFVGGSLLCQGSILSGGRVERSIIGPDAFVDADAHITDSVLFQSARIGANAKVVRAILDKNVVVGPRVQIGTDREHDLARHFTISDGGIVVVPKGVRVFE